MAFKLFKNGDELYDDSQELIKRGEFDKARDYLIKSIDKEGGTDDVAAVQVALIDLSDRLNSAQAYQNLLTALDRLTSATIVQFGLETIDVAEMKTECELTIRKMTLLSSGDGTPGMERGQQLIALAQDFQSRIGDRSLIALSLFRKDTSVTGTTEFYNLMALAYEIMADATVGDNPSQAAEYQQIAAGYRQQNGQSAEENLRSANLGFREGVIQTSTVMEAQAAWLKAQSQKIDAEIDVKLSQVNLQKALGTLEQ